jgi:hypothetical protein
MAHTPQPRLVLIVLLVISALSSTAIPTPLPEIVLF